ncbi:chromate efflux transporter [Novosphingobium cyanobacteriorum]|uniref:Chromate efflux transporter n=1 Tax=Novosphingobium cyanobacteriorum TaxID=3024215 RepID=A0ABT6CI45_9SPHN|nr:chromate efflux transporter [Novosphingobium cyanobacteriorum]MDF8333594.1 chromate efflux transporter [Novosphingobium cyanobacteriorum]
MDERAAAPTFGEFIKAFGRIGCLSFGGPAGQIALMQHEIVDRRGWVEQGAFLRALNLCHLLPGPEAQQLATWIGWRLFGVRGGLAAGLLFVIPGALVMLGLSLLYAMAAGLGWFAALFLGIKAAVLAVVAQALMRVAKRALGTRFKWVLAALAAIPLTVLHAPFPLVILGAGVIGAVVSRTRPEWLGAHHAPTAAADRAPTHRLVLQTLGTVAAWGAIWALPLVAVFALLGPHHVLWQVGLFFSRLAVVTFGGAYAVLAYMAQQAVSGYGWLMPGEMADGLGLAETTPGPLIMVTQFVGFLAAWRHPGELSPLVAGLLGAGLTTWVTFAPCFLWIFACAPWMERLEHAERLQGALAAITAAVVGVIANLALWFALHVLFRTVTPGGLPVLASLDWRAALIAAGAAAMLFGLKRGIMETLAACALGGLALSAF